MHYFIVSGSVEEAVMRQLEAAKEAAFLIQKHDIYSQLEKKAIEACHLAWGARLTLEEFKELATSNEAVSSQYRDLGSQFSEQAEKARLEMQGVHSSLDKLVDLIRHPITKT